MKRHDIFIGLLFILAAALIVLNQLGFLIGISIFDLAITAVLVIIIFKSLVYRSFFGVLFPLALIGIIYADELDITRFTPWPILVTALFLSIGLSILFGKHHHHNWGYNNHDHNSFTGKVVNESDENVINCSTSFGESIRYVNSADFQRANISCSFGEMKVYFDNAQIPSGKAEIHLDVSFGHAVLFIPRRWKVICKANVFLGDMNRDGNPAEDAPTVTVYGNVSFGEAKIVYV